MNKKEKQFHDLITKGFADCAEMYKVRHRLSQIRDIMGRSHPGFLRLSAEKQYGYCVTIGLIATQTTRHNLSAIKLSGDISEYFPYSTDQGLLKSRRGS